MTALMAGTYCFGKFVVDVRCACLRRDGALVPLRPKSFDVLLYLARNRGRLVSKGELFDNVWANVVVTDNSLVQCIKEVRKALGDERQTIVETVAKRGYVFTPEVVEDSDRVELTAPVLDDKSPVLALPERPSIAVLPFTNMSGDPDHEYFADGLSEDLITGLARIRWLFVIARNSSFVYKGRAVDVKRVSRELGVRYVLEGSVRRAGKSLRVSAQLIDAVTGGHHWAERYDRELGDIFAVQDEITQSVAGAIEPHLLAAEGMRTGGRSPHDLGAWELVAQAQTRFWRMTRPDFETAIRHLEQTVASYPDYAPARSLLGFRLVFAAHMGWIGRAQGLPAGRQHAFRAIALDDRDPWAHIALGYSAMMERRTEESIAAFRRAVNLNPNSAAAHSYLSHIFAFSGHDYEAIAHGEEAIRLSPLDPEMAFFLGGIAVAHYAAGRFAESVRYTTEALRLRPGFQGAQRLRCASLAQVGQIDEARALLATIRLEHPDLSVEWIRESIPYQTPKLTKLFIEGLYKAGLNDN